MKYIISALSIAILVAAACMPRPTVKAVLAPPTPSAAPIANVQSAGRKVWYTPDSTFTECMDAGSGPAGRIEEAQGMNPIVTETDGGQAVEVKVYRESTSVTWRFYRSKEKCELAEVNQEKKLADKYR